MIVQNLKVKNNDPKGKFAKHGILKTPDGKVAFWDFNRVTHEVVLEDVTPWVSEKVQTIIIGTGYNGAAYLAPEALELVEQLKSKGIKTFIEKSVDAAKLFNSSSKQGLLAFFHLNC